MIGKGKFFDIISRTAEDCNNPEILIDTMLKNYDKRLEKYIKQMDIENK